MLYWSIHNYYGRSFSYCSYNKLLCHQRQTKQRGIKIYRLCLSVRPPRNYYSYSQELIFTSNNSSEISINFQYYCQTAILFRILVRKLFAIKYVNQRNNYCTSDFIQDSVDLPYKYNLSGYLTQCMYSRTVPSLGGIQFSALYLIMKYSSLILHGNYIFHIWVHMQISQHYLCYLLTDRFLFARRSHL